MRTSHALTLILVLSSGAPGCIDPGVGEPFSPEQVPSAPAPLDAVPPPGCETITGFNPSEKYIESPALQCRSRIGIVLDFEGNPRKGFVCRVETDAMGVTTITKESATCRGAPNEGASLEYPECIYCTCKCDGLNARCGPSDCPDGFGCCELFQAPPFPVGLAGSYCVRLNEAGECP